MTEYGTAGVDQFKTYTQARNQIFDVIIPEVAEKCQQGKTAALIIFLIERKAAGYHKDAAEVSLEQMETFTNGSRSDVKRARAWLIAHGYIELMGGGNGLETSNLRIVLDSQERDTMLKDKPAKIISLPPESTCQPTNAITDGEEVPQTPDSDTVEPHHHAPEQEPETSTTPDPTPDPTSDPTSDSSSQISENENADKASEIKGVLTEPPSRASKDLVLVPGLVQEQTKSEAKKREAFGAVCSFAKSQNFGMEDRDYAFTRWAVDAYGAEVVLEKIEIAEMQKGRNIKFAAPLGWLRDALTRDYQPTKYDGEVKKAKEKARREIERSQREQSARESERRKWAEYREQNPNAAQNALAEFLGGLGK